MVAFFNINNNCTSFSQISLVLTNQNIEGILCPPSPNIKVKHQKKGKGVENNKLKDKTLYTK